MDAGCIAPEARPLQPVRVQGPNELLSSWALEGPTNGLGTPDLQSLWGRVKSAPLADIHDTDIDGLVCALQRLSLQELSETYACLHVALPNLLRIKRRVMRHSGQPDNVQVCSLGKLGDVDEIWNEASSVFFQWPPCVPEINGEQLKFKLAQVVNSVSLLAGVVYVPLEVAVEKLGFLPAQERRVEIEGAAYYPCFLEVNIWVEKHGETIDGVSLISLSVSSTEIGFGSSLAPQKETHLGTIHRINAELPKEALSFMKTIATDADGEANSYSVTRHPVHLYTFPQEGLIDTGLDGYDEPSNMLNALTATAEFARIASLRLLVAVRQSAISAMEAADVDLRATDVDPATCFITSVVGLADYSAKFDPDFGACDLAELQVVRCHQVGARAGVSFCWLTGSKFSVQLWLNRSSLPHGSGRILRQTFAGHGKRLA